MSSIRFLTEILKEKKHTVDENKLRLINIVILVLGLLFVLLNNRYYACKVINCWYKNQILRYIIQLCLIYFYSLILLILN